jgi:UDP-N-acetylmuramoylalanine--D-glutamate ligase
VGWRGGELVWREGSAEQVLLAEGDVLLPGAHNRVNVAAAAALARSFGVAPEAIARGARGVTAVEHRLELVVEVGGVRFVNDTAATAPEAAIAALGSFAQPIVLIAGGADKNLPFEELADTIVRRAKALVLLQGSATPKLQAALGGADLPVRGPLDSLDAAVREARDLAAPGDVVLLSPGCASFGMFRNEFHRGEEFRRIVQQLAGEAG